MFSLIFRVLDWRIINWQLNLPSRRVQIWPDFCVSQFYFARKFHHKNLMIMNWSTEKLSILESRFFIFFYFICLSYMFQGPDAEELSLLSVQIVSRFLFHTGFHTKKCLRGQATDWYDAIYYHIRAFASVRSWIAHNILFKHPNRYEKISKKCI